LLTEEDLVVERQLLLVKTDFTTFFVGELDHVTVLAGAICQVKPYGQMQLPFFAVDCRNMRGLRILPIRQKLAKKSQCFDKIRLTRAAPADKNGYGIEFNIDVKTLKVFDNHTPQHNCLL